MNNLLTAEETAERLRVTVDTLKRWRMQKSGPPYLNLSDGRGAVRYPEAALDQWINDRLMSA